MKSKIVKIEKKGSKGIGGTTATMKSVIYYKTSENKLAIIEVPDNIDLAELLSVQLHFGDTTQTCSIEGKPASKGLYTLSNEFFGVHGYDKVQEVEAVVKKQLNLGAYEYTVNAVRIFGSANKKK